MGRKNQSSSGKQVRKGYDYGPDIVDHPVVSEDEHAATQPTGAVKVYGFGAMALALIAVGLFAMHSCNKPEQKMIVPVPVIRPISSARLTVIQERQGEIKPAKHRHYSQSACSGAMGIDCGAILTVKTPEDEYILVEDRVYKKSVNVKDRNIRFERDIFKVPAESSALINGSKGTIVMKDCITIAY